MDKVKPLARQIIDAWALSACGLPVRVVRRLNGIHARTVGDLRTLDRKQLARLPGIGDTSIKAIDRFRTRCVELESGPAGFPSLDALLKAFLSPTRFDVLILRYGLDSPSDPTISLHPLTLQEIGSRRGMTRERVRQIDAETLAILDTHLVQAFLSPMFESIEAILRRHGGAATPAAVNREADAAFFSGFTPARVVRLLGSRRHPPLSFIGLFTLLSPAHLTQLENSVTAFLKRAESPQPLDALRTALTDWRAETAGNLDDAVLPRVLDCLPRVCATRDTRYFLPDHGAQSMLYDILRRFTAPLHYRVVVNAYNALIQPGSRKGTGTILRLLKTSPGIQRTGAGYYRLVGESIRESGVRGQEAGVRIRNQVDTCQRADRSGIHLPR